jgi:hypothetical protein
MCHADAFSPARGLAIVWILPPQQPVMRSPMQILSCAADERKDSPFFVDPEHGTSAE